MRSHIGTGRARNRVTLVASAAALGTALIMAGSASAATVDCKGKLFPSDGAKSAKAFDYEFSCTSPQGIPEMPTVIDAYSIISTKDVAGFSASALVFDSGGEVVPDEAFACEGPIPGAGFGCNGVASLNTTVVGSLNLSDNPCSEKGRRTPFKTWVVVASDKINETTLKHTKTSSEPFKLSAPKCDATNKGKGKGGKRP